MSRESQTLASTATETTVEPTPLRQWPDMLESASAPMGWQVTPCENSALLCVEAGEKFVGTVEFISYPLADIQRQTEESRSDASEANSDLETLRQWVANHYKTIQTDRAQADPTLVFLPRASEEVSVGGLPGLRYGFTIRHSSDILAERTVGYITTDGTTLYLFVTGLTNGDPAGTFLSDAALQQFEPHLAEIMAELSL
ncbi:MAG: hypothetical protein HC929_19095 [Leptolyngbyaceae cyanobacterium SM2_5_2]|nr:hypothetical protein [Leptolyngbyaceae cyanobacterium SM2_5_2]